MSRIRHATETFVNHLIDGVKKLISSNTEQINVLESKVEMMEDCTSGYIADHISIAVNKGIKRGYFMAVNVQDISEKNWGYDIEFRMGETPRVIVFSTRSRTGETYIRELDTSTRAWSYDWKPIATTSKTDILCTAKAGFTISSYKGKLGDVCGGATFVVRKTDGTPFTANGVAGAIVKLDIPSNCIITGSAVGIDSNGWWFVPVGVSSTTDGTIYYGLYTSMTSITAIEFTLSILKV